MDLEESAEQHRASVQLAMAWDNQGTYLPYVCFSCSRKFFVKLTRLIEDFLLKNDDVKSLYLSEDWIWENGKLEKKHNISLINQNVKNRFTNFVLKNYGEWAGR